VTRPGGTRPGGTVIGAAAGLARLAAETGREALGAVTEARGKRFPLVVVTGAAGSGKTVLAQHLQRARMRSYTPSAARSEQEEHIDQPLWRGRGVRFRVVPGHGEGGVRYASLARLLHTEPVVGVVHVVANGFRSRRADGAEPATAALSLDELLAQHRAQEQAELDETLTHLKMAIAAHHRPRWFVLAQAKADLYADDLPTLRAGQAPGGSSEVARSIDALREFVGTGGLRWESLPVATWLEDYTWGDEVRPTTLSTAERDELLRVFRERISALVGHV
jgi:hypothetical protein